MSHGQAYADSCHTAEDVGESDELSKFEKWKAEKKKVIRDLADLMQYLFGGVHDTSLDKLILVDHKK